MSTTSLLVERLKRVVDGLAEAANDLEQIDRDLQSLRPPAPRPRTKLKVVQAEKEASLDA